MQFVVGSRKSNLALKQSEWVVEKLKEADSSHSYEIKKVVTKGDRILNVTLAKIGGKGLFVKEIERALFDGDIDFAVHSMKDMPSQLPPGLVVAAIPQREDPRDVLVTMNGETIDELPKGAVVGTSSLRRGAQLKHVRPDLVIEPIRGNIDTRLARLESGPFSAIVLAAAGLKRTGKVEKLKVQFLPTDLCLPAVGQGALAIECREDDESIRKLLAAVHDEQTFRTVMCERAFLRTLEGSCEAPIAGYCREMEDGTLRLEGLVASPCGREVYRDSKEGRDPEEVGRRLALELLERGAARLLQTLGESYE